MDATDSGFATHSLDAKRCDETDLDRFPINDDEIHLSFDGIIEQGYELWDTLQTVDQSCTNSESVVSGGEGSDLIEVVP